jgi:hypothetical protein
MAATAIMTTTTTATPVRAIQLRHRLSRASMACVRAIFPRASCLVLLALDTANPSSAVT